MEKESEKKKPRILCLHGFRGSAEILKKLVLRWPESVVDKLDLVFLDAPFPAQGKSALEGFFDPPYFEWFQSNKDFTEYYNFEECLEYIEDFMSKHGPFDGVLGFSQVNLITIFFLFSVFFPEAGSLPPQGRSKGAVLGAAIPGMQRERVALTKVQEIKFVIIISGAKFGGPSFGVPQLAANVFSSPINCPSLHFLGETDLQKKDGEILLESFVDPQVIHHSKGHTIPRLDDSSLEIMLGFIEKVQKL
ncbi:PREDICTED: esterase AGAP003155-like isoform X1 [Nicotiana attenuata]|uniref:Rhodanese-like domain-containing protein 6 n=1 Tax=Nicotiana attenuata TaxID=49451 RepID=A0A1J6HU45_NICAT|nr:PREDICTED: esterase AGAP003155-like isoform X1 [Nicotiana attenuata]OIS95945.1 rhodanese-like domain-containing protein 6 [Nicotiana attenuata]